MHLSSLLVMSQQWWPTKVSKFRT